LQQFVADEVDLIFVYPTEATIVAKDVTAGTDIPVVFAYVVLDAAEGLVDSVQAPGGNLTGVRYPGSEFGVLRYEMLRDIVPDLERIVVPYQRGYPTVQSQLDGIYALTEADGVTIIEVPADVGEEIAAFFQAQTEAGNFDVDAILTLIEPLGGRPDAFAAITSFAKERNIPIGGTYTTAEAYSSIFGVWAEPFSSGLLAAPLADKIIQGIEPGTIPIVSPEPHIQINYQMAQELGLQIPETLLVRANQIYR
jgi:putative ABC transport system substrate-binding protein